MAELKPCPFCGGEAKFSTWKVEIADQKSSNIIVRFYSKIECNECGVNPIDCRKNITVWFDKTGTIQTSEGVGEMVEAWNRRTEHDILPRLQIPHSKQLEV